MVQCVSEKHLCLHRKTKPKMAEKQEYEGVQFHAATQVNILCTASSLRHFQ